MTTNQQLIATAPQGQYSSGGQMCWKQCAVVTLCFLVTVSCQQQAKPSYSPVKFRASVERLIAAGQFAAATKLLRVTDPVRLANAAVDAADLKVFMIAEEVIFAPGIENKWGETSDESRKWYMPGTNDVLEGRDHKTWHDTAREFAAEYNSAIRPHLSDAQSEYK